MSNPYTQVGQMAADVFFPLVVRYIQGALTKHSKTPAFRDVLTQLMAQPGRILAPHGQAKWPVFVLDTCQLLGGEPVNAVAAAAAVEFAVAAADVVDDLVDDEWDSGIVPWRQAANATLALSQLAQSCALDCSAALGSTRAQRISSFIAQGMAAACAGEDLDLVLETLPMASEEQAHNMTWQKSGSLVAMACQVGAATATDDPTILELVGRFGAHVGIVAQLLNDIAGVDPDEPGRGSDLRRKKKTLPIAYALRCASEEDLSAVLNWSHSTTPLSNQEATHLALIMRDLGALHYTWVVADTHRREALAVVQELVKLTERHDVYGLRQLIPAVRARRTRNTVR